MDHSRRGFFGFLAGLTGSVFAGAKLPAPAAAAVPAAPAPVPVAPVTWPLVGPHAKIREALRARLGDDIYRSWFHTLEIESFDGRTVTVSVPVKFLRTWIKSHYHDDLLACCRAEYVGARHVNVILRQPGGSLTEAERRKILEEAKRLRDA